MAFFNNPFIYELKKQEKPMDAKSSWRSLRQERLLANKAKRGCCGSVSDLMRDIGSCLTCNTIKRSEWLNVAPEGKIQDLWNI